MDKNESIFNKIKSEHFFELIDQCDIFRGIDKNDLLNEYKIHVKNHLNSNPIDSKVNRLQNKWYESIKTNPEYEIYNHPYYICDIWLCWTHYSRQSLLSLKNPKSLIDRSVLSFIGDPKLVVDLGCGFGYSTAGLKEFFPKAEVIGTNLKESYQFKIAQNIGNKRGFTVLENSNDLRAVDLVFASEYFEHIINPIEHLYYILKNSRPKIMVIANGFNGTAIGHFNNYIHQGKTYTNKAMNTMFGEALKYLGYKKVKTKIWNNRPALWIKA